MAHTAIVIAVCVFYTDKILVGNKIYCNFAV